jgi:hypothetical protein
VVVMLCGGEDGGCRSDSYAGPTLGKVDAGQGSVSALEAGMLIDAEATRGVDTDPGEGLMWARVGEVVDHKVSR